MIRNRIKNNTIKYLVFSFIILFIFIAGILIGYYVPAYISEKDSCIPSLYINGDVLNVLKINDLDLDSFREEIKQDNNKLKVLNLGKIIDFAEPAYSNYGVYIIANDGKSAKLSGKQLEKSYIYLNSATGWESINLNHPVSTNIRGISEITVVIEGRASDFGLNIMDMNSNLVYITPGMANLFSSRFLENNGTSFKDSENIRYEASAFQDLKIVKIEDFLKSGSFESMMLVSAAGETRFIKNPKDTGYFELKGNTFNYTDTRRNEEISDLKGVVINPSVASIMDVYYDATGFIDGGKKVLLIITDGFGYHQYEYAINNSYAPYLASISKAKKALSVYQPVSNSGLAAMFTGKPPDENGIYSRKQREPLVPTIFGQLLNAGRQGILIEGDIQLIKTETDAVLHTDMNSSGTIDDEILKSAMGSLDCKAAFIAVHFHSIDDAGHSYKDISEKTMERVKTIDSYIEKLVLNWDGKVIITSDHGMHSTGESGSHGELRFEDMVVPYIVINGGL